MATIALTKTLRDQYQNLFDRCHIRPERQAEVASILTRIDQHKARYSAVADIIGAPWYAIAVIHNMEASLRFDRHLHNGDPLTGRTVQVPAGRPKTGKPPFTWERSAIDALNLRKWPQCKDWSLTGLLYQIEGYNGWGYRLYHPQVLSPYLWGGSQHYSSGKYIQDGTWSDSAKSQQCGAATLLRRMAEQRVIELAPATRTAMPLIRYGPNTVSADALALQHFLNQLPGIFVKADGQAGEKTSDAFKQATGYYLSGDPRQ